ncbi:MAG: putative DtxR family transcriptional regulator [Acidimicrobiaceae bacterium]|nr:putative DtxR family transcriptional regulator [Acidimicrobiaceae bacterium]
MADGFHPPLEEYLETIHALTEEGVDVIQARLVERLRHSPQAVSEMVRRLADDGYLVRAGREVELTEQGRQRAESVVRRHRLAERFLVDVVGLAWSRAHEEAGRWEHVISDDVEARFVEILGHPTTCPHGNPIPGTPPDDVPQWAMADTAPGDHVRLARITEQVEIDSAALLYLDEHGLVPGQGAHVRSRAPDGTLTLELDGGDGTRTVAVGAAMCRQLYVTSA